jgi:L-malate glycosyltransferase
MDKKTILHLTGMTSKKYGGLEHYLIELISICNQRGFKTVLQYETLPKSEAYVNDLHKLGVHIIIIKTRLNMFEALWKLIGLIGSVRPDIIHTHFSAGLAAPIARLWGTRKIIATVHSMVYMRRLSLGRFAYRWYDYILCVSNAIAVYLQNCGVNNDKISTHYLGLYGDYERSDSLRKHYRNEFRIPEKAPVIGCIAFDNPVKGLDILLEAFKDVITFHPESHLLIIGVDPQKSALIGIADKLGLANCVHWAGIRDEGWQLLNAADIYVQPSRSEGISLAIMEAMALRLPVVASRIGGIPEAVVEGETGYLFTAGNVPDCARAINRMLADPSEWSAIGEAGYAVYNCKFRGGSSIQTLIDNYYS